MTASGLVAAALALFAWLGAGGPETIVTGLAERRVAALEDGTRLHLNAQSEIELVPAAGDRRIRLLRGEAAIVAGHGAARPLRLETPAGTIRVTGARFNVRTLSSGGVEITVLAGNVTVRSGDTGAAGGGGETAVVAGAQAVLSAAGVSVREIGAAVHDVAAWREGQVVFDNATLREALERFGPYHRQPIVIDPAVADLPLGGRYRLDDLTGLLEAVARVLPVDVIRESDGRVRIGAAGQRPAR